MAMAAAANNEVKKAKALANQQAAQEQKMQQQVQKAQAEQEQKEQIMEQRRVMLKAILSPEAAARISNIRVAKEERAIELENLLIQQAQRGLIKGKISDDYVRNILKQISDQAAEQKKKAKVEIDRKKIVDDPDEPDLDNLWDDDSE